jgi:NitT/TauT family transport system ATP-binding protein
MSIEKGLTDVRNVSVNFRSNGAAIETVKSVSLHVQPGEFVSFIGPSGCSKLTLLNVVAGFTAPSSGTVLLDDVPIKGPGSDRGMVFQQHSLFPWMTVRKNAQFGLKVKDVSLNQRQTQARTLLGMAGLLAFENPYLDQLSSGMKQRVGIVLALATSPQMLLMDEPFGALDSPTRSVMQGILANMWRQMRLSVLFINHDIEEAVFLSDRIHVMTAPP